MIPIEQLRQKFPWPATCPRVRTKHHGWMNGKDVMLRWTGPGVRVAVELGTWLGMSARLFYDNCPNATVICIDHWLGNEEHKREDIHRAMLPTLYETFLANMFDCRDRIIPVRADTITGMNIVAELGIEPDFIYVDASHDAESVYRDATHALTTFPDANVFGDDWGCYPTVVHGVTRAVDELGLLDSLCSEDCIWWVDRNG